MEKTKEERLIKIFDQYEIYNETGTLYPLLETEMGSELYDEVVKYSDLQTSSRDERIKVLEAELEHEKTMSDNIQEHYNSLTSTCNDLAGALEGVEQLKELIEYPEGVQDDMLGKAQAITQMFLQIRLALTKHRNTLKR